ncbi:MAG: hypothetical protein ACP5GX_11435, partial [Anaerolineae bacterium]
MEINLESPYLRLLKDSIDIVRVPFSDRGSRLLIFREPESCRLLIKLAERLISLQADIDAYRYRPPYVRDLSLVDGEGNELDFEVDTYPHALYFHTRIGTFALVFQDNRTLKFGVPAGEKAGLRFHVLPQFWEETAHGGVF